MLQDHIAAINSGNCVSNCVYSTAVINLSNADFEDFAFNLTKDQPWLSGKAYVLVRSPKQTIVALVEDSHCAYVGLVAQS
jgi:hypothetical protein